MKFVLLALDRKRGRLLVYDAESMDAAIALAGRTPAARLGGGV